MGSQLPLHRRLIAWASLVLLALNVLTSTALPMHVAQAEQFASLGGVWGDVDQICRVGDHAAAGQDGTPRTPSSHKGHCGFCLPLGHLALAVPAVPASVRGPQSVALDLTIPHQQPSCSATGLLTSLSPRAPPLA